MTQPGSTSSTPPPPPTTGTTPPPPSATGGGAAKQGLPVWAWVGIGCGCLVIVGLLVVVGLVAFGGKKLVDFAQEVESNPAKAVELAIRLNPELELVETDAEARKVTVRNKKTGEVGTLDFSDIENGNFSFEGSDGSKFSVRGEEGRIEATDSEGSTSTFGAQELKDVPDWVHLYPDAPAEVGFTQRGGGQTTGMLTQTTDASIDEVAEYFEAYFEGEGWEVSRSQMSSGQDRFVVLTGNSAGGEFNQSLQVARNDEGKTVLSLQYNGPE